MSVLKAMFGSKKFWYAIVGVAVVIVGQFSPEWADTIDQMLKGIIALIIGQGIADVNKATVRP